MIGFSWIAKVKLEYANAGGVPIAIPINCSKNISPNMKTLFPITSPSVSVGASAGMVSKRDSRGASTG